MQARPLAPCVHTRMLTHTHTLVLVHHGPRMRAPRRPPPAPQILCPPRPGKDPVDLMEEWTAKALSGCAGGSRPACADGPQGAAIGIDPHDEYVGFALASVHDTGSKA